MALDRTWYNTLVDDTGDNLTGTVWNKAAVDSLMDAVDAALAAASVVGNWTPTDASGAGLALTVFDAKYVQTGKQVTAWGAINYPVTANGTAAKLGGLPVAALANTGAIGLYGGTVTRSNYAGALSLEVVNGGTTMIPYIASTGVAPTNANLSNLYLAFAVTYRVP